MMLKALLILFIIAIDVAVGTISYSLIAAAQANWWQLITYIWIFFWPVVALLGALRYFWQLWQQASAAISFGEKRPSLNCFLVW